VPITPSICASTVGSAARAVGVDRAQQVAQKVGRALGACRGGLRARAFGARFLQARERADEAADERDDGRGAQPERERVAPQVAARAIPAVGAHRVDRAAVEPAPQVVGERDGADVAPRRIVRGRARDDRAQRRRQRRGVVAAHEFVEHAPQAVDVGRGRQARAGALFRTRVARRVRLLHQRRLGRDAFVQQL
jgi:hypothetical protein